MSIDGSLFSTDQPVALVTGSSAHRVGRTIASTLANEGCQMAIHGNTSQEEGEAFVAELRSQQVNAEFFSADFSDPAQSASLVEQVIGRYGRLDIVVNSAAIWYPTPLDKVTNSELEEFYRVNSLAPFMIAKSAGFVMAGQQKGGVIINIGDWSPARPYLDYPAYFLSKGNLPTMTRMLAVELAARNPGIRVNAVLPGPVMIPDDLPGETRQAIINSTLVKREGSPQNIADACLSLIENDFVTGVCFPVDGGRSIYSPYNPV